ncbi:ankyrin repeat domain-containing protein [Aspergillus stella-maris]|uniref:ankyrin repeat domain-containing protein n=1 Tax=Aspergillus stella-maris TaxID=1810926 RepID=UPI003CCE4670
MTTLLDLPNELLLSIAENLEYSWDVNSLSLVCKRFPELLQTCLFQFNNQYSIASALNWAASYGSHAMVRKFLDRAVLTDQLNEQTWNSAMSGAASNGNLELIQALIDTRETIKGSSEWSLNLAESLHQPLWNAADEGHASIVRLYLDHGTIPFREEPFDQGKRWVHAEVIKILVDWNLRNPNVLRDTTVTSFCLAALSNSESDASIRDIVNHCLEHGADPNAQYVFASILEHAALQGYTETVRCLLEHGADPNPTGAGNDLPILRKAFTMNIIPKTSRIVLESLDIQQVRRSAENDSLLMCVAAACGLERIVEELLRSGYNPNIRHYGKCWIELDTYQEKTAIEWASRFGQEGIVRLLLQHGATLSAQALAGALLCQSVPITRLLLDLGVDPNKCPPQYSEDCHALALVAGHEKLFRLLLEQSSDAQHGPSHQAHYLMRKAMESGTIAHIQMLLDRGHSLKGRFTYDPILNALDRLELLTSATKGGIEMLNFLFSTGFEILQVDTTKHRIESPLNVACARSDLAAMKLLLNKGQCTSQGYNPDFVISNIFTNHIPFDDALEILDTLLSRGADINNAYGGRGVSGAISSVSGGNPNPRALKALLDRGADPLRKDQRWYFCGTRDNPTFLETAAFQGDKEGVTLMLDALMTRTPVGDVENEVKRLKALAKERERWRGYRALDRFQRENGFDVS